MVKKVLFLLAFVTSVAMMPAAYYAFEIQNSGQHNPRSPDAVAGETVPVRIQGAEHYLTQDEATVYGVTMQIWTLLIGVFVLLWICLWLVARSSRRRATATSKETRPY